MTTVFLDEQGFEEALQTIEADGVADSLRFIYKQNQIILEKYALLEERVKNIEEVFITKVEEPINALSTRLDRFTTGTARSNTTQTKRGGGKKEVKRVGGPKNRNILGWIKDQWEVQGAKLFDFVEDYETIIEAILEDNEDELKKRKGVMKKKTEAALIWNEFKRINKKEVVPIMQAKFDEFKKIETKKSENKASPTSSSSGDSSSDSD